MTSADFLFPLIIRPVNAGGIDIKIMMPDPEAVKTWYQSMLQANTSPGFPYWTKLWPASLALADYLTQRPSLLQDKDVLEVAAGLGLPSLFAARVCREVICTDYQEDAIKIAAMSAGINGYNRVKTTLYDWNQPWQGLKPDIVLLSDVNYEPEAFPALIERIHEFLQHGAIVLIATPQRLMAKPFIEQLLVHCRSTEIVPVTEENGQQTMISIYELAAR